MFLKNKFEVRYTFIICYILSLLPVFLPWCYFDKEIDGIKYGIDLIHPVLLVTLVGITLASMIFLKNKKGKIIISILLLMHVLINLFYGLFWYVPTITDFRLLLSLDGAHYGFYLSLFCSGLMYLLFLWKSHSRKSMPLLGE